MIASFCIHFIVGTGRCGTQLLMKILNCHPKIQVVPETHFIPTLYDKFGTNEISFGDFCGVVDNFIGSNGDKWIKVLLRSANKSYDGFWSQFKGYCDEKSFTFDIKGFTEKLLIFLYGEEKIFIDKTPHYGIEACLLKRIWPEAKVIHLMRDGVDCALSMTKHPGFIYFINGKVPPKQIGRIMYFGKQLEYSSKTPSLEEALLFWEKLFLMINAEIKRISKQEDVLEIRYEDIITDPSKLIPHIINFVDHNLMNGKYVKRAVCIPRPFPEKRQIGKLPEKEYENYRRIVIRGMELGGYPYSVSPKRGFSGWIKECYRGRYYYLEQMPFYNVVFSLRNKILSDAHK